MFGRIRCAGLLLAALLTGPAAAAQSLYDDPATAVGWVWRQVRDDKIADLATRTPPGGSARCGVLDPQKANPTDPCHQIPASFVVDVLTTPGLKAQMGRHGFRLENALIDGPVDLADAEISSEVWIEGSRIEGALTLGGSHWGHLLWLGGTTIAGNLPAARMMSSSDLLLTANTRVLGDVTLSGGHFGGDVDLSGSSFGGVNGNHMTIGGSLFIRDKAVIDGDMDLTIAKIGGAVVIFSSSFKKIDAGGLTTSGIVYLDSSTFDGDLNMNGALLGDGLWAPGSTFEGRVLFEAAEVKGDAILRGIVVPHGDLDLRGSKITGLLMLDGASATNINLTQAEIGELGLRGLGWRCFSAAPPATPPAGGGTAPTPPPLPPPMHWKLGDPAWHDPGCGNQPEPLFVLRNAHVGSFQDSEDAWPPALDLEGFHYDRVGGLGGQTADDMRRRATDKWQDWLDRDPVFSTQPYTQLSAVLTAQGHRDKGEEIEYAGRERERHQTDSWWAWAWMTLLWLISGYGIGLHTFFAGVWVIGLTIVGALVMLASPLARTHGWTRRLGASLHRLLPVIELSKDFTDFFDNLPKEEIPSPRRRRLLKAYFAGHAVAGYVLGFFLIAAMGGLTQK